jgi:threonine dehydratase
MKYQSRSCGVNVVLLMLALLASGVVGCMMQSDRGFEVVPVSNRNVISLSSDDVVRVMRRAGFSDEQILELGTAVHSGMLTSGAVQIKLNNKVEVVFAANGDDVYIGTRLRGNFIYNVKTGWNRPGGVLP